MSIDNEMKTLCAAGKLALLEPAVPSFMVRRHVFVGGEARSFIFWDGSIDEDFESVSGRTFSVLERFSNGSYIAVGMDPHDKEARSQIARVDPVDQGIFAFRINDPNPAVRIFGGFAKVDVVILLTWWPREDCDFPSEVARCRAEWDKLFPNHPPILSDEIEDHVSKHFHIS
ncbi:hypothetical protein [Ensifer sp. OV372]|uniref:hypothetical protein n=1 Tax=Ensifer sp. OV372 TaxID=1855293 RepID=UPI0011609396|nr:hypothetical protein [Ensifer sp. OV372]